MSRRAHEGRRGGQLAERAVRPRAPRGQGPVLREEILDATTRLIAATGNVDAVSIRALADAVGVTPPSIYRHFADKQTLVFATCQREFQRLADRVARVLDGHPEPLDRLGAIGRAYVAFGLEHPEPYRVLFMTPHGHVAAHVDAAELAGLAAYQLLVACIRDAMEAGAIAARDPQPVAFACWAAMHGLVSLLIARDHLDPRFPWPDPDAAVDLQLALLLRSLA